MIEQMEIGRPVAAIDTVRPQIVTQSSESEEEEEAKSDNLQQAPN